MISFIDDTGHERFLGNLPAEKTRCHWPVYGDVPQCPMVPRSEWYEVDMDMFISPVKDQDGVGACNAFATVNAAEACRRLVGLPDVRLSPGYLYGNINGGSDRGSMLEDALVWMMEHGTCTAMTVPELAWRRHQWPAPVAAEEAKAYRFLEAYWCPTVDHMGSALLKGFFLDLGILWAPNFKPDGDGWLPERASGGAGGHAIVGCGLKNRGGKWGIKMVNSWGERWGRNGRAIIPEALFRGPVGGWWAVRGMTTEATDVPAPKN